MTIHDELILEFIKPNEQGDPTGNAFIKIVGAGGKKARYHLERIFVLPDPEYAREYAIHENIYLDMTPDIAAENLNSGRWTAIELETDIHWDFAHSLRQVRKYKKNSQFQNVVVIIPMEYKRFAVLYKKQGFDVWLWKATRMWECMRCGEVMEEEKTPKPKCSSKSCSSTEQRLDCFDRSINEG